MDMMLFLVEVEKFHPLISTFLTQHSKIELKK